MTNETSVAGLDFGEAIRALKASQHIPREFTADETDAFAYHWARALDQSRNFHGERMPAAVKACRTLFPGRNVAGYSNACLKLLRERATAAQAMRALLEASPRAIGG